MAWSRFCICSIPGMPSSALPGSAAPRYSDVPTVTSPGNSMPPAPPDSGASTTRKYLNGRGPRRCSHSVSASLAYCSTRLPTSASRAAKWLSTVTPPTVVVALW